MTWREPTEHKIDCYFCLDNTKSIGKKNRHKISYPSIPSAIRPTLHSDELPIPVFKGFLPSEDVGSDQEQETADETQEILSESSDPSYETPQSLTPQQFNQPEINDLVRDLGLSKKAAKLLASSLQEKNQLSHTTKVSYYRNREQAFVPFFTEENKFVYCHNISGLLQELGMPLYHPNDWRLFLDSSKHSLKCVLLHNGKFYAAVSIGHSVYLREEHNDINTVIDLLKYHEDNWTIWVDLKMVNFLLGQQRGFTKSPCYICMWDSRAQEKHWNQKEWPIRETLKAGIANIVKDPIVSRENIIFLPLHIKLVLMKQSVKV